MRKLLIVTALAMLSVGAGCRNCDWLWRGSYNPPRQEVMPIMTTAPCAAAPDCNACAPAIVPQPGYVPGS